VLHYNGAQTIGLKNKVWRGLGAQVPWVPREMPGQPGPSSGSRCLWATRGETVWGRETESSNNAGNTSQKCLWCYHLMFSASWWCWQASTKLLTFIIIFIYMKRAS